jgi:hypothetical protein
MDPGGGDRGTERIGDDHIVGVGSSIAERYPTRPIVNHLICHHQAPSSYTHALHAVEARDHALHAGSLSEIYPSPPHPLHQSVVHGQAESTSENPHPEPGRGTIACGACIGALDGEAGQIDRNPVGIDRNRRRIRIGHREIPSEDVAPGLADRHGKAGRVPGEASRLHRTRLVDLRHAI